MNDTHVKTHYGATILLSLSMSPLFSSDHYQKSTSFYLYHILDDFVSKKNYPVELFALI